MVKKLRISLKTQWQQKTEVYNYSWYALTWNEKFIEQNRFYFVRILSPILWSQLCIFRFFFFFWLFYVWHMSDMWSFLFVMRCHWIVTASTCMTTNIMWKWHTFMFIFGARFYMQCIYFQFRSRSNFIRKWKMKIRKRMISNSEWCEQWWKCTHD